MIAHKSNLGHANACGVQALWGFHSGDEAKLKQLKKDGYNVALASDPQAASGGIDYCLAAFNGTEVCKKMYEELKEHQDIVFQSPEIKNANSGNPFFFIIFKAKEQK